MSPTSSPVTPFQTCDEATLREAEQPESAEHKAPRLQALDSSTDDPAESFAARSVATGVALLVPVVVRSQRPVSSGSQVVR